MGGYGSGRWGGYRPKRTVENCTRINIQNLIKARPPVGKQRRAAFEFTYNTNSQRVTRVIRITSDLLPSGGLRYWFECPTCLRRCTDLYLPPNSHYFACRLCHHLTYHSSQAAHEFDALARSIGIPPKVLNGLRKYYRKLETES